MAVDRTKKDKTGLKPENSMFCKTSYKNTAMSPLIKAATYCRCSTFK